MARKKKETSSLDFTPSPYQEAIFDFIRNGKGNVVVEACAGSGKSSTLIKLLDIIKEDEKVLFCAFNKEIVKDLTKKIGTRPNVDIRTVHSLGYKLISKYIDQNLAVDDGKYRNQVYRNLSLYTDTSLHSLGRKTFSTYTNNIIKLIDHIRYNLISTQDEINEILERHGINIVADEIETAFAILDWGKNNLKTVDYGDMVWLPNLIDMKDESFIFDYIFFDECQDASIAQRELILQLQGENTRYVFVGDRNQSIYSFMSASPDTFDKLKELPNTITLPLSISYRCASNIVKFAQNIVSNIEANDDGRTGCVVKNAHLDEVEDGDMVLCRTNAPLMQVYGNLIRMNKECYIRGKDIGKNMIKLVKETKQEMLNVDLRADGVFVRLYESLFKIRDSIITKTGLPLKVVMSNAAIVHLLDMIRALEILAEGCETSEELIARIDGIFQDKHKGGIALSTVHKAKGLEANNVYIACPSLMPSSYATQDWEIEQEQNLMYVAYTRAKNKLAFLDEKGFKKFNGIPQSELQQIENQIDHVLHNSPLYPSALKGYSGVPVTRSHKIVRPTIGGSTVLQPRKPSTSTSLSDFMKRRTNMKKRY